MKIAHEHLLRHFQERPSIENISDKLLQLGHEHEINNKIFDVEFTPNRGDCLSVYGLARDLSVFFNRVSCFSDLKSIDKLPALKLNFVNNCPEACSHISFLNIKVNNLNFEYKDYLNNYFKLLNTNKTNFFTDVCNYIAYELGQPLHSYNFDSIQGNIILDINQKVSEFETIHGKEILLKDDELIFLSNGKVINVAGIMGSKGTACSSDTSNVLIECASFKPEYIINKATKLDINSDASHKFERGVDPLLHDLVLRRFIQIVEDHTDIADISIHRKTYRKYEHKIINIDFEILKKIIGFDVKKSICINILENLGFNFIDEESLIVPSHRFDINQINDLAEEIARVIGYDNIPRKPFKIRATKSDTDVNSDIKKIRSFLITKGFYEVINSSFDECQDNSIEVDNPLDKSRKYIRSNISASLIKNLIYNLNRQKDSIKLFEISDIYTNSGVEKRLGIIIAGRQGANRLDFNKKLDKNYLISIFSELDIDIAENINAVDKLKFKSKTKNDAYSIEFNIQDIKDKFQNIVPVDDKIEKYVKYKKTSEFPRSVRDISFAFKNEENVNNAINYIEHLKIENLKEFYIFDFYKNEKTSEIKIGYRFIFQSEDRTLTDIEVNGYIENILKPILQMDAVSVPGYK